MSAELSHSIELTPAFHDLDPLGIVWHGHYPKYLELARTALLQRFDYDYPQMLESGYHWPIVDLHIKYVGMLRYGQQLQVDAHIAEWENRLRINYQIKSLNDGKVLTKAHSIQVAVAIASQEMQYVCPPVLGQRLGLLP